MPLLSIRGRSYSNDKKRQQKDMWHSGMVNAIGKRLCSLLFDGITPAKIRKAREVTIIREKRCSVFLHNCGKSGVRHECPGDSKLRRKRSHDGPMPVARTEYANIRQLEPGVYDFASLRITKWIANHPCTSVKTQECVIERIGNPTISFVSTSSSHRLL
jgi:hypothetical protein